MLMHITIPPTSPLTRRVVIHRRIYLCKFSSGCVPLTRQHAVKKAIACAIRNETTSVRNTRLAQRLAEE